MKFIPHAFPHRLLSRKLPAAIVSGATALAVLAGCSHVPIMSIPALAAIDFQTTQFSALRAAIQVPDILVPQPDGVRLNVSLTIEGAVAEERSYALVRQDPSTLSADLPEARNGRQTYVFALSPEDQLGLEAIRRAVEAAKVNEQSGSLSISVDVRDICTQEPLPDSPLRVDVFLMTSETERFVRTLDGYDLQEIRGTLMENDVPIC